MCLPTVASKCDELPIVHRFLCCLGTGVLTETIAGLPSKLSGVFFVVLFSNHNIYQDIENFLQLVVVIICSINSVTPTCMKSVV